MHFKHAQKNAPLLFARRQGKFGSNFGLLLPWKQQQWRYEMPEFYEFQKSLWCNKYKYFGTPRTFFLHAQVPALLFFFHSTVWKVIAILWWRKRNAAYSQTQVTQFGESSQSVFLLIALNNLVPLANLTTLLFNLTPNHLWTNEKFQSQDR